MSVAISQSLVCLRVFLRTPHAIPRLTKRALRVARAPEPTAPQGKCVPKYPLVLAAARICQDCSGTLRSQCRQVVPSGVWCYFPTRIPITQASPKAVYANKAPSQTISHVGPVGCENYVPNLFPETAPVGETVGPRCRRPLPRGRLRTPPRSYARLGAVAGAWTQNWAGTIMRP